MYTYMAADVRSGAPVQPKVRDVMNAIATLVAWPLRKDGTRKSRRCIALAPAQGCYAQTETIQIILARLFRKDDTYEPRGVERTQRED